MPPNDHRSDEDIRIKLSHDEALVLFDFLTRFSHEQRLETEHQAEERVLWNIQCNLESILAEPLTGDYTERLAQARDKVRDRDVPPKT